MTTFVCLEFVFVCLFFCYCIYFAIIFVVVDFDGQTSCFFPKSFNFWVRLKNLCMFLAECSMECWNIACVTDQSVC